MLLIDAGPQDGLEDGTCKAMVLEDGRAVALYRVDGVYFATEDRCSHGEAALSDGELDGDIIICPFHLGGFCVRTGAARIPPCSEPIRTYPVIIRDGRVLLDVTE